MNSMPKLPSLPKMKSTVKCACGCSGLTQSRFVPGHDSKLKGMVLRVKAGVWNAQAKDDVDAQLDALAEFMGPSYAEATAAEMRVDWTTEEWLERADLKAEAVNS